MTVLSPVTEALRNLWEFTLEEFHGLLFGLNFSFLSSFGQTFFLSLFVPHFLEAFGLSEADFGLIYSGLTLVSASLLPWVGGRIDFVPLRYYGLSVMGGLGLGALVTAGAGSIPMLVFGLFLMRFCGQGLSGHTSQTAVGRHYESRRGKGLSLANLGLPVGEGLLPLATTALIGWLSWQGTLMSITGLILVGFVPVQLLLLNRSSIPGRTVPATDDNQSASEDGPGQWQVLRTLLTRLRFWLLLPAVILPAFWVTGLFLYQAKLANQSGWTLEILATAFLGYGAARILFSLGIGPAIDQSRARVLFPFYLLPFGAGLGCAWYGGPTWMAFAYLGFLGVTMGAGTSLKTALWAELYGLRVLGSVRSLYSGIMVLSTAMSPALFGWLLELGFSTRTLLAWALVTVGLGFVGALVGCQIREPAL